MVIALLSEWFRTAKCDTKRDSAFRLGGSRNEGNEDNIKELCLVNQVVSGKGQVVQS